VTLHTRPQPGLAPESVVKMKEARPLPSGAFRYDLDRDPGEETPEALDDPLALAAAQVFATSVGRMAPGLQVLTAASRGPAVVAFRTPGTTKLSQVFSISATNLTSAGGKVEVRWDQAFPFALAAFAGSSQEMPAHEEGSVWSWLDGSKPVRIERSGTFLWWDGRAALIQRGHDETVARLKSLGYIR
jgi:hypothetical protein